jgi:hypothetical protein
MHLSSFLPGKPFSDFAPSSVILVTTFHIVQAHVRDLRARCKFSCPYTVATSKARRLRLIPLNQAAFGSICDESRLSDGLNPMDR